MCRWIGLRDGSPSTRRQSGRRDSGADGFTLLEVLVAFAVLAVMLVPILQVFGGGLGTTETARAYAEAALLARSKLAEIGADAALEEGERSGNFDERGYRWRATIARDTSDVTLPDNTVVGARERRQSRSGRSADAGASRGGSGGSGFGQGKSGFGAGGSGFGQSKSGSGFDQSKSGGAFRSSRAPGQSSGGAGARGFAQGGTAVDEGDIEGDMVAQLVAYQITVTVEWDGSRGSGEVTLTSLRIEREAEPAVDAGQ